MAHSFQVSGVKGIVELTYASAEKSLQSLTAPTIQTVKTKAERYSYEFPRRSTSEEQRNRCAPPYSEMHKTANKLFRIATMHSVNKH